MNFEVFKPKLTGQEKEKKQQRDVFEKEAVNAQKILNEKVSYGLDTIIMDYNMGMDSARRHDCRKELVSDYTPNINISKTTIQEEICGAEPDKKLEKPKEKFSILKKLFSKKIISPDEVIEAEAYLEKEIREKINNPNCDEKEKEEYKKILEKMQRSFIVAEVGEETFDPGDGPLRGIKGLKGIIDGKNIEIWKYDPSYAHPDPENISYSKCKVEGRRITQRDVKLLLDEYFIVGKMRRDIINQIVRNKIRDLIFPQVNEILKTRQKRAEAKEAKRNKWQQEKNYEAQKNKKEEEESRKIIEKIIGAKNLPL